MNRKLTLTALLALVISLLLCAFCALAEEEEEEASFFDHKDSIVLTPGPTASPTPVIAFYTPAPSEVTVPPRMVVAVPSFTRTAAFRP